VKGQDDERGVAFEDADALIRMLAVEEIDRDLFRGTLVFDDGEALFGGQVAAQALMAAGLSVTPDRSPHSLHGYFLRAGDASRPTIFQVYRDRDGRSYSARRVVALQGGEVIFNMSASFHVAEDGVDYEVTAMPEVPAPQDAPAWELPRLFSMEGRLPPQPYAAALYPTRMWARTTAILPDSQLPHACVLTYLSDFSTGLAPIDGDSSIPSSSLDHAVWFHRPCRMDRWVLMDLVPHSAAGGRGWYSGSVFDESGVLVASLTQEMLFRRRDPGPAR
jgi:acyl-CoA thioesterase-2